MSEKLKFLPPEIQYISAQHVFEIPASDPHLKNPWELRLFAAQLVEHKIGDEAQVTSLKIKKPALFKRAKSRFSGQAPTVLLYVTIKF